MKMKTNLVLILCASFFFYKCTNAPANTTASNDSTNNQLKYGGYASQKERRQPLTKQHGLDLGENRLRRTLRPIQPA